MLGSAEITAARLRRKAGNPAFAMKQSRFKPKLIDGEDVLAGEVKALARSCPHMRGIVQLVGQPPLRYYGAGLEGLARIVVGQQLSIASAGAIWGRVIARVQPFEPRAILLAPHEELAACGLSRAKIATLKAIAQAVAAEGMDLGRLAGLDDIAIRDRLVGIRGIGPWTADIFLLFCLGRPDAFAPGDLALQLAAMRLLELEARPSPAELEAIAERWRPRRAVAARLLWAYYGATRKAAAAPV
jgi:DNA-3-methyladenine glycosylase II